MEAWWNDLSLMKQIFYLIAIPSTAILIIQSVMTLVGLGDNGDSDIVDHADGHDVVDVASDTLHDVAHSGLDGFRFFTLRGIIAFLTVFGWSGVAFSDTLSFIITMVIATAAGIVAMTLVGLAFWGILKLQSRGNLDFRFSIGLSGEVYLTVPPERTGSGKVNVTLQERLIEADAVTDEPTRLITGTRVRVTGILGNNVLVVCKDMEGTHHES